MNRIYPESLTRSTQERRLIAERRKQIGISFPSARTQEHLLIIRLDIAPSATENKMRVRQGLKTLCNLFDRIEKGTHKIDKLLDNGEMVRLPLSEFNFSATIGFGSGFFRKLNIDQKNRPKRLREMPDYFGLSDSTPYILSQTDIIIQLGSTIDVVNRWVLENATHPIVKHKKGRPGRHLGGTRSIDEEYNNTPDISTAIREWAILSDLHSGFQRIDGRNLMGFNDGISNPNRLLNDVVWTTKEDEGEKFKDGTYMVFQKIEHDLEKWRNLDVEEQERWVGRSKGTGLLLGTLPKNEDDKLASDLQSDDPVIRGPALTKLRKLIKEQRDPNKRLFDTSDSRFRNIRVECPIWSHVRKANPRGADHVDKRLIFRRGYLYVENAMTNRLSSGLLFICFQRDISKGFEYIKRNWLNNKNFPVPEARRNFTREELTRYKLAHSSLNQLKTLEITETIPMSLSSKEYTDQIAASQNEDMRTTGKEGLAGPSQLGLRPKGEFLATIPLGGGYYFIPPIPHKNISDIGEQFFD